MLKFSVFASVLQRLEERRRRVAFDPDRLPPIPQEPIVLLFISILLFVIGRKIYLHVIADGQHHSQV